MSPWVVVLVITDCLDSGIKEWIIGNDGIEGATYLESFAAEAAPTDYIDIVGAASAANRDDIRGGDSVIFIEWP